MNSLCSPTLLQQFTTLFSKQKEAVISSEQKANTPCVSEAGSSRTVVDSLKSTKDDPQAFLKVLMKSPKLVIQNLVVLEAQMTASTGCEVITALSNADIENLVNDAQVQAYLFYLKLKLKILVHNAGTSMQSLMAKTYDFNVDRLIAEFMENLMHLKSLQKFILFEDQDDASLRQVISQRMLFFETLSSKLFKILIGLSCNIDLCKDNVYLIQLTRKLKEYCTINDWYLMTVGSFNLENSQQEKLKGFVNAFAKDLLKYISVFALNRERESVEEECRVLSVICAILKKLARTHPLAFTKFKNGLEDFGDRLRSMKSKIQPEEPVLLKNRRVFSDSKIAQPLTRIEEDSLEDIEFEESMRELSQFWANHKISPIQQETSQFHRQSLLMEASEIEAFKLDIKSKEKARVVMNTLTRRSSGSLY